MGDGMHTPKLRIKSLTLLLALVLLAPGVANAERKTRWLGGAIIGGSVGLTCGLLTDLMIMKFTSAMCSGSGCKGAGAGVYVAVPLVSTAFGGGAGALIGMAFKRKHAEQTVQVAPMLDPATGTKGLMVQGSF